MALTSLQMNVDFPPRLNCLSVKQVAMKTLTNSKTRLSVPPGVRTHYSHGMLKTVELKDVSYAMSIKIYFPASEYRATIVKTPFVILLL